MAQFQSPLWTHIRGHMRFDSFDWYEPRLRTASRLWGHRSLQLVTGCASLWESPEQLKASILRCRSWCDSPSSFDSICYLQPQ
ncbi:hypothetical protein TNIN_81581 [Trichonephila inaurata madagascariensis]|uniref:Uncharacterized protein n=1 Tax=Trichonephila inaurata madagascariensis TaxID=2747483 RepID=A0A8X7C0X8_9ARAC|nr:hypothetical protein TNIN_81581 [Trichonephila inaurata madagascariensis]